MYFEPLSESHSLALLDFELINQEFFEEVIAPRNDDFYSIAGVQKHITSQVTKTDVPAFVFVDNSQIIARANIRNIGNDGSAEIGYRVAETTTGSGVGSMSVARLVEEAVALNLRQLTAYVMGNNPASEKVLVKNGFQLNLCLPRGFQHQGTTINGFKYQRLV